MAGFRKAKPQQAAIKMAIYGPPGSGKTFTALLLAEGLARATGKRIAAVDTERGMDFYATAIAERRVHPEAFDMDVLFSRSITEIDREVRALGKGHGVVILDSVTHLWEAARNAYSGPQTRAGTLPIHAWGKIKKPYKALETFLLSSPMHVIWCGRQGNEFETDPETEEMKRVGYKMKAEGETPYEPHILIRMESVRGKAGLVPVAVVEKDRSGVLAGRAIEWPTFDNLVAPILKYLDPSLVQGHIPSEDEVAAADIEANQQAESERLAKSVAHLEQFTARMMLAATVEELAEVGKCITPAIKSAMVREHVGKLKDVYEERARRLRGEPPTVVPDEASE